MDSLIKHNANQDKLEQLYKQYPFEKEHGYLTDYKPYFVQWRKNEDGQVVDVQFDLHHKRNPILKKKVIIDWVDIKVKYPHLYKYIRIQLLEKFHELN